MALGTFPWGPASIQANTATPTPGMALDPAGNYVTVTADLAALAAGISWKVLIQYQGPSTGTSWIDYGSAGGTTIGGPAHDRQGKVVETGLRSGVFPDPGAAGRQVRAVCTLGVAATLSGHVTTSAA